MKTISLIVTTLVGVFLAGCATRGAVSDIPEALAAKPATLTKPYTFAPLIVSVRWPAVIDPSIADDLKVAWQSFGGLTSDEKFSLGVLSASNTYHAAQTYVALRKAMPEAKIVLEPQLLTKDKDGGIGLTPIGDASLPVALVVDLVSFDTASFPFMGSSLSFVLRSPSALSPGNCGLLVAAQHQLLASAAKCTPTSFAVTSKPPLWYVGAYDKASQYTGAISKLPLDAEHTLVYPRIRISSASVVGASRPPHVTNGTPATLDDIYKIELDPLVANIAAVTSGAPAVLTTTDVANRMLERYIRTFDPPLADATLSGAPLSPQQQANVLLVRKLLTSELQARTKRDATTTGWILTGEFGTSYREAREKSYSGFNKMMLTSWLSAIAVTSAGAATGAFNAANPAYFSNQASMIMTHMTNVDIAMKEFNTSFVPAAQAIEKATIDFEGTKVTIDLYDQQALTRALRDIYARYKQGPALSTKPTTRAAATARTKKTP